MGEIIVRHRDGEQYSLQSRQRVSSVTKAEQKVSLLGEDVVNIMVKSCEPIPFEVGDTITVFGKRYKLNQLPKVTKNASRQFEYSVTFEGPQYDLVDANFLLPDDTVMDSFTGNLAEFVGFVVSNANRVSPGKWKSGVVPNGTEYKTLTYTETNCLNVLQQLCKEYDTEFDITTDDDGVNSINIRDVGRAFPLQFEYGRTGGATKLVRTNVTSKDLITRLFVFGGSNNVPNEYIHTHGSQKLTLPGKTKNTSYKENASALAIYGVKEGVKSFDDIFPNRYGTVTSVNSYNKFVDSSMDFDLNEKKENGDTKWLINGVTAKVHFNTGNLAGYDIDLHAYNNSTKEFWLIPFEDNNGMKFPNSESSAFQLQVGDVYFIKDIRLPQSYIDQAEEELNEKAEEYYEQYSQPQCSYSLDLDENFVRGIYAEGTTGVFGIGDYVHIKDVAIGVDKDIRITSFSRDVLSPYKYTLTLADSYSKAAIARVVSDINRVNTIIEMNNLADPARARRNWRTSQESLAMVFDTEGNYYSDKIAPKSIETTQLAVGAASRQFTVFGTLIEPNYGGDVNAVKVTGGALNHYGVTEDGSIRTWNIASATTEDLDDDTPYYLYAKCEKGDGLTGGVVTIDTEQRQADGGQYYYFLLGTLSSVMADADGSNPARFVSLSYGSSTITGRFVTTGRIQSGDGKVYMDLDEGEIGGNIVFRRGDELLPVQEGFNELSYLTDSLEDATEVSGGLVLTNNIKVKKSGIVSAGLAGTGSEGEVAIWAGSDNKESAPFRVTHDGALTASNANINGVVTATSGALGGFELANGRIGRNNTPGSYLSGTGLSLYNDMLLFQKLGHNIGIGFNLLPAQSNAQASAMISKSQYIAGRSYGAYLSITGGSTGNDAVLADNGNILAKNGFVGSTNFLYVQPVEDGKMVNLPLAQRYVFAPRTAGHSGYFALPKISVVRAALGIPSGDFWFDISLLTRPNGGIYTNIYGRNNSVSGMSVTDYPRIYVYTQQTNTYESKDWISVYTATMRAALCVVEGNYFCVMDKM